MLNVHLIHIPKTGGLTLHRALQAAGIPATRSHDPMEARKQPPGTLFVMVLRDPVERVLSVYRYRKSKGEDVGTLREFLDTPGDPRWWGPRNVQAWYASVCCHLSVIVELDPDSAIERMCYECRVDVPEYETQNKTPPIDMRLSRIECETIERLNWFDRVLWEKMSNG